jgi:hypothetical protein
MQKLGRYKNCIIDAKVHERADRRGWIDEIYIARDVGFSTLDTPFYLDKTFDTAEEAMTAAVEFAKQKIDSGILSTTVAEDK